MAAIDRTEEHETSNTGERHPQAKLSELDVIEIKWRLESGEQHQDIADDFEVSRSCIGSINSERLWDHVKPFRCTYCMDDDKLRIYSSYRFSDQVKEQIKNAGFRWAPKQECWFCVWSIRAEDLCSRLSGFVEDEDYSPEERAADRAERFGGYRDKRRSEAGAYADRFEAGPDAHGYQNAARAERAAARHDRQRDRALCQWSKAEYWQARTAGVISHALHRSDPKTRRGRILEIEKEIRRIESEYTPRDSKTIMQSDWRDNSENPQKYEHAWCGAGRGGHWVRVDRLDAIKASYARYVEHLNMRLIYENGMLANEGGKAADVEIVPGGFLGMHQIHKVNKSNTTGRVVSVKIKGEWGFIRVNGQRLYCDHADDNGLVNVNIERCGESIYRAPTPEELEAFNANQKTAKAEKKATAAKGPSLINPTMEDAQRLQDIWNSKRSSNTRPGQVIRMTQEGYSARAKGSYSPAETVSITERGLIYYQNYNGIEWSGHRITCKVRVFKSEGVRSVVVIVDKPQKPLPWNLITETGDNPPSRQEVIDSLPELAEARRGKSWFSDMGEETCERWKRAASWGFTTYASESQFSLTHQAEAILKELPAEQAAAGQLF